MSNFWTHMSKLFKTLDIYQTQTAQGLKYSICPICPTFLYKVLNMGNSR